MSKASSRPLSEAELQRMEFVAANTEGDRGFQFQHTQHFAALVDEYRKLKEDVKRWKEMHAQAKGKKP